MRESDEENAYYDPRVAALPKPKERGAEVAVGHENLEGAKEDSSRKRTTQGGDVEPRSPTDALFDAAAVTELPGIRLKTLRFRPPTTPFKVPRTAALPHAEHAPADVPRRIIFFGKKKEEARPPAKKPKRVPQPLEVQLRLVGYSNHMLRVLEASPFLRRLWELHHEMASESCFPETPRLLLPLEEVEGSILWDEALAHFAAPRLRGGSTPSAPAKDVAGKPVEHSLTEEAGLCYTVPPEVGLHSRLTVWQSALARILDRYVLAYAYLDGLRSPSYRRTDSEDLELFGCRQLVAFHQAVLWSARLIRLASSFSIGAATFAAAVIDYWTLHSNSPQVERSGSPIVRTPSRLKAPGGTDVLPLSPDDPLASLRLFEYDRVFVSARPHMEEGGGFFGILVLGSPNADVDYACSMYGKELQAHRWLCSALVELKIVYARARLKMHNIGGVNLGSKSRKSRLASHGEFSMRQWLSSPLTSLTPLLMNVVDYRGFRVAVYPLFQRPPMAVDPSSMKTGTRIRREMQDAEARIGSRFTPKYLGEAFDLLELERDYPSLAVVHKAHRLLLHEVNIPATPGGRLGFESGAHVAHGSSTLRPELPTVQTLAELSMHSVKRRSDLPDPHYAPRNIRLASKTYPSVECHMGEPFGTAAFERASKGFNQFVIPRPTFLELHDVRQQRLIGDPPDGGPHARPLTEFLYMSALPGALQALESQPFFTPCDSAGLKRWLEAAGISCRHLGRLLNTARPAWLQRLLAVDIVARTLKHVLLSCIRSVSFSQQTRSGVEEEEIVKEPSPLLMITSGVPLPTHLATRLFERDQAQVLQRPPSDVPNITIRLAGPETKETQTPLADVPKLFALNLLRMALGTDRSSRSLWTDVIAPQAEQRYSCNRVLIHQSNCPSVALVKAFCHHTGLKLAVDTVTLASRRRRPTVRRSTDGGQRRYLVLVAHSPYFR